MAKISFALFFLVALIFSAVSMMPHVGAIGRNCKIASIGMGCDPTNCKKQCLQKYNGDGICLGPVTQNCACFFDCEV